jgi:hypothetical protein
MSKKIRKSGKLVYGWGINDANYNVNPYEDGKRIICPYYRIWNHILERCHSTKFKESDPTYMNCTVDESWKNFSSFRNWMVTQDWQGKQLDKDLLFKGNKQYSKDTAVFVSRHINAFISDINTRGRLLGAYYCQENTTKPYKALCCGKYLGYYQTEIEAHLAWKRRKHELACLLAEKETDPRIIHALTTRYAGDDIYEA